MSEQRTRRRIRVAEIEPASPTACQYFHMIWLAPEYRRPWELLMDYMLTLPPPDCAISKPKKKSIPRVKSRRR